ncbi:hypothetical protein [Sporosarcina sp. SAFN-010]|uniref:hypothetical protein n=1 Tax=Sporosarcina sp. SAFN-010 TaxID=3387273 RepID=UPI003F7CE232
MQKIIDLFEQTSMTLDDMEYFCNKHNLRYSLVDDYMTVTDGNDVVKFTIVKDDVVINIFDYDY